MERSDFQIAQLARSGDQTAFYQLYSASRDLAYTAAATVATTEQEIRSLLLWAYLTAFERLGMFSATDRFDRWLAMIVLERAQPHSGLPDGVREMPGSMARELYQEIMLGLSGGGKKPRQPRQRQRREFTKKWAAVLIAAAVVLGVGVPVAVNRFLVRREERALERQAIIAARELEELSRQEQRNNEWYEQAAGELASEREAALAERGAPEDGQPEQQE